MISSNFQHLIGEQKQMRKEKVTGEMGKGNFVWLERAFLSHGRAKEKPAGRENGKPKMEE